MVSSAHVAKDLIWLLRKCLACSHLATTFEEHAASCAAPQCKITLTKVAKHQKGFTSLIKGGSQWPLTVFLSGLCPSTPTADEVCGLHIKPFVDRLRGVQRLESELLEALQLADGCDILARWARNSDALVPDADTSLALIGNDMFRLGLIPADSPLAKHASDELDKSAEV